MNPEAQAVLAAQAEKRKMIGDIILLLWETNPEDSLPSRRELIRLIRGKFGFHLQFCPECRHWLPPSSMVPRQGKKDRYDKPRRCTACARKIKNALSVKYRQERKERKLTVSDKLLYYNQSHSPLQRLSIRRIEKKKGACRFRMPDGTLCGVSFEGPANRKFCDTHSKRVKMGGK